MINFKSFSITSLLITVILAITACSMDRLSQVQDRQDVNHVGMSVCPVAFDGMVKSEFSITDNKFRFTWQESDTVGIFPNAGSQAYFSMATFAGSNTATFEGGGWALKGDGEHSYAAYAPYKFENQNMTCIPFSYKGQTFDGNDEFAGVAKFQYLGCPAQVPQAGVLNYDLKRLEAVLWFKLKMPDAKTYESFLIKVADGTPIAVSTTVDFTQENIVITTKDTQSAYMVPLTNVQTAAKDAYINIYMMLPPQDFTGKKIVVSVNTIDGDSCRAEIDGKNHEMNHGYIYEATLTSDLGSLVEKLNGEGGNWE